ncbi:DUF2846 domain-containing protein [Gammaproteobacteria bacterium]|nr:DUF2846 domain-containing protein [Gammaproteobacteria bacterium]
MKKMIVAVATLVLLVSCATVPQGDSTLDAKLKTFEPPPPTKAGIYIYRTGGLGTAVKRSLFIDNVLIGDSAPNFYYHRYVDPGLRTVSTKSEFGRNKAVINAEGGENYYFKAYMKMGVITAGSDIVQVGKDEGQTGVLKSRLAK